VSAVESARKKKKWLFRKYVFPDDCPLLWRVVVLTAAYYILIRCSPFDYIVQRAARQSRPCRRRANAMCADALLADKVWRATTFLLCRLLRSQKPCLCRTLVLHHWFSRLGSVITARVGVFVKGGQLQSHAWILLNGEPFREDMTELAKYMPVLEW
jgi:hypothetical protein